MRFFTLSFLIVLFVSLGVAQSQERETPAPKNQKEKPFTELIKDFRKIDGLFPVYYNEDENKYYLAISPKHLSKNYLANVTRQTGDAAFFDAGALLGNYVFRIEKIGKKLQFIMKNVDFRADTLNPISRAIEHSFSTSLMASAPLLSEAEASTGAWLIDASVVFLQDFANVVNTMSMMKKTFTFDKGESYIVEAASFPLNTEIELALHFKATKPEGASTLPDSRSMIHRYHLSLSTLPETGYKPRTADDRVGHFTTMYRDYTSLYDETPAKHYVERWHLEKANPELAVSEPKQPIVFWMDNSIPLELRDYVKRGIEMWQPAFERIGFKNAIIAKQRPDTADWDPADVRYNVIRWIIQPGGGYAVGPSRANPFTGQIYDADIRISADFIRSMSRSFDFAIEPGVGHQDMGHHHNDRECRYADHAVTDMAFGQDVLFARGLLDAPEMKQRYIKEYVISLVAHEVGHTLGLRHNFKASAINTVAELHDSTITRRKGLSGSVMDYQPVNLSPKNMPQGEFYHTELGPYDYWAIEYAYKPFDGKSFASENEMLQSIAAKNTRPELRYGTDEDCFGNSVAGVDPLCNLFDYGSNPMEYFAERIAMSKEILAALPQKAINKGENFNRVRVMFSRALGQYSQGVAVISKYIGGLYTHRNHAGDANETAPFIPVPPQEQRSALDFLIKNYLTTDAFSFSPNLLQQLGINRLSDGEDSRRDRLDFGVHDAVKNIMTSPLYRLFNSTVLQRIRDNELRTVAPFTQQELFETVRNALWEENTKSNDNQSYKRDVQRTHADIVCSILTEKEQYNRDAVALARQDCQIIRETAKKGLKKSTGITKAHLEDIIAQCNNALEPKKEKSND
jgi:hypothetical protein